MFTDISDEAPVQLIPLLNYFEETWIKFSDIKIWNMYGVEKRTNNDVEGKNFDFIIRFVAGIILSFFFRLAQPLQ